MRTLLISMCLLAFLPSAYAAPKKLADGICPFNEAKIAANFTPALRRDYTEKGIAQSFLRRESWYGACTSAVAEGKNRFVLHYADATVTLGLLMKSGKIEQYEFLKTSIEKDTWAKFAAFLKAKWPSSALYVSDKGDEQNVRADDFLFIGEGRILPLMNALEMKISAGELKNDQKVKLLDSDKAQELDELAGENEGYALSISELKARIFTELDRTASDMVLRLVGLGVVESNREATIPFLSRREAGWLMTLSPADMAKLERGGARKAAAKLDRAKAIPPLPAERYDHLDKLEWKGSARELCDSLTALAAVPELKNGLGSNGFRSVHPTWKSAVYYAARDFGVAQTTWVATLPGRTSPTCFSLVLNAREALDEGEAEEIHARAVSLLIQP